MSRHIICLLLLLLSAATATAQDDPIRKALDISRQKYEAEIQSCRASAITWFDQRERVARKDGNKKELDQIKEERKALDETNQLPLSVPARLRQKALAARATQEDAFKLAIKNYTRAKLDAQAAATEKELEAFKSGFRFVDTRQRWIHPNGEFRMVGNDAWEEKSPSGKVHRYKEIDRTSEYVELDAMTGDTNTRIRLYESRCDSGRKPNVNFKALFMGN